MGLSNQLKTQGDQIAFLKKVSLFADLHEADLIKFAAEFRTGTYRRGDTIFHQGDQSRELYVVRRGKVRIFHLAPNGEETTVNILTRGRIIGEFAIIDSQPRSATAKALNKCILLGISQSRFLHYLETIPGLGLAMCKQLVYKARWTSMYAETIAQFDAAGRLLHFVLLYNEEFGEVEEAGRRYVLDLGLTQTDLATLVGARRGWVNHILQDWRKRGLIEFDHGKITILDLPRVQAERDSRMVS